MIEEPRAVIGSHLIRMPKEAPNDYFKYSDLTPFARLHRVRVRRLDDSSGYRRKSLRLTAQRDDCLLLLSQAFEDRHCKISARSGGGDAGKQRTQVRLNALKTYDNRRRPYLSIRRPVGRCLETHALGRHVGKLSPLSRRLR